jgi:methyl-branched lipid omega-hydroxylase
VAPSASITVDGIELGLTDFWLKPIEERAAAFARLRAEVPVSYHHEVDSLPGAAANTGFWSVTRYADVREVNRKAHLFSSADGVTVGDNNNPEITEFFGSMITMDDPRHAKFRLLVQKAFTPKMVAGIEENVRVRARRLVDEAREMGSCDFVEKFAAPLPLQVICDMLGIPESDEKQIFDWTNVILGIGDPEFGASFDKLIEAAMGMFQYALALGEDRLANPRDDLTSTLMHAEVEGQRLTASEFGSFFILLAVAGNETTRNAISWGAKLLTDNPDQRAMLAADFASQSLAFADETVRWSSPVIHMRRKTNEDVEVAGQLIPAGEKVVMWFWSANRDESVFPDGDRFDITRPNAKEQAGYGGGGPHFCLGANLARREIQVMFEELFTTLPDFHIVGEPDRLMSSFINGIKRLPVEFTPR